MVRKIKISMKVRPRVRAPCEENMRVGAEVEYQTGIAEYGRGRVTTVNLDSDSVSIIGYEWPVPLRDVIELASLPAFSAWRVQWLDLAADAMSPSGMDREDVFYFASDNDGNLRSAFKAGKDVVISVSEHAGCVAHLPRFDNVTGKRL